MSLKLTDPVIAASSLVVIDPSKATGASLTGLTVIVIVWIPLSAVPSLTL